MREFAKKFADSPFVWGMDVSIGMIVVSLYFGSGLHTILQVNESGILSEKGDCFMDNSPIVSQINALLAEKGVQKQQFYKDCGITSASYSFWNTGKTSPRRKNLDVIANYLNTTTDYLLTGLGEREKASILAGDRSNSKSIERICMDEDLLILAQRLENVPEKTRKRILKNFTDLY